MPKFVIERQIPGVGSLSERDLKAISQKSSRILKQMGSQVQWVESYITGDKTYCVYISPNEELIKEHAALSGFPANSICQVTSIIDPTTGD